MAAPIQLAQTSYQSKQKTTHQPTRSDQEQPLETSQLEDKPPKTSESGQASTEEELFEEHTDARQRVFSEEIQAALKRFRIEPPFTLVQLDDKHIFWLDRVPESKVAQVNQDYETLLQLAG